VGKEPSPDLQRSESREARERETPQMMPRTPECPFCAGQDTEIMNAFGAHASVSTYWCLACRSPFEMMRWQAEP